MINGPGSKCQTIRYNGQLGNGVLNNYTLQVIIMCTTGALARILEHTCNKCCNLMGHSEVSISHRDLQVPIETYKLVLEAIIIDCIANDK